MRARQEHLCCNCVQVGTLCLAAGSLRLEGPTLKSLPFTNGYNHLAFNSAFYGSQRGYARLYGTRKKKKVLRVGSKFPVITGALTGFSFPSAHIGSTLRLYTFKKSGRFSSMVREVPDMHTVDEVFGYVTKNRPVVSTGKFGHGHIMIFSNTLPFTRRWPCR